MTPISTEHLVWLGTKQAWYYYDPGRCGMDHTSLHYVVKSSGEKKKKKKKGKDDKEAKQK